MKTKILFVLSLFLVPHLLYAARNGGHSIGVGVVIGVIFMIVFWVVDKLKDPKMPQNIHQNYKHFLYVDHEGKDVPFEIPQEVHIKENSIVFKGYINEEYEIIDCKHMENKNFLYHCRNIDGDKSVIFDSKKSNMCLCGYPLKESSFDSHLYIFTNYPLSEAR